MQKLIKKKPSMAESNILSRRKFLSISAQLGIASALSPFFIQKVLAESQALSGVALYKPNSIKSPDWIAEARISGFSISSDSNNHQLKVQLNRLIKQGVNVVTADSRLSDYLSDSEFIQEMQLVKRVTEISHQQGLKVVWYIPALEVITPNGVTRQDSFARVHKDWLQTSFDGQSRGVFYGQKVFWVEKNDESAWLCPNSPYRDWFKNNIQQLAATGVDGIWLDVPIFDQISVTFSCSCHYCRDKFHTQTGFTFPERYDVSDQSFWHYLRWRHQTITEFLNDCKTAIEQTNPNTVTMAEIVALDHTGASQLGSEGSDLHNILVVWEVDAISETTAMAEASYDDWIAMYNIYKYCRGATMDRPSWAFSYSYAEADAQMVLASTIASQNNPYELRTPMMGSTIGEEFRATHFNWIKRYSKQIYRSHSLAPVAVLYSERNRDLLDITKNGGIFVSTHSPGRDRSWLGKRNNSAIELDYLGDYRGLSVLLFQNQIPTDVYPISRINPELLAHYSVLVVPSMVSLTEKEKSLLLSAVSQGSSLIITGEEAGSRDHNAIKRSQNLWSDIIPNSSESKISKNYGKGKIHFWKDNIGQRYLKSHDKEISNQLLQWIKQSGVESWVSHQLPVVIQPYIYQQQLVIHALNYSWVGDLNNKPNRLKLELSIPWDFDTNPVKISQTEAEWKNEKSLDFKKSNNKLTFTADIGINAIFLIELS